MKNSIPYLLTLLLFQGLMLSCNDFPGSTSEAQDQKMPESAVEELPEGDREVELQTSAEEVQGQVGNSTGAAKEFYQLRDYAPAWSKADIRTTFLEELQNAGYEGLFMKDYYNGDVKELLENSEDLDEAEAARLDILLTEAFFSYAHDLYYGKLDPKELYKNWGVARKEKDLKKVLEEGLQNNNITQALESLKPPHQIYRDLKKSLREYATLREQEKDFTPIATGELIKPGQRDQRLPAIAERLRELGFLAADVPDSLYQEDLQKGAEKFQEERGIQVDGVIGNSTIAQLNMTAKDRYRQILANLERWRWYPRDLGEHYILINIPQFRLAVVKEGDTVRTHNVIAGTRSRQTPVFSDTLQHVVINPTWTVPPTIKTKDVIPKASSNPSYLASHNMKVYEDGKLLDPARIDWSSDKARSYTIVQRSGPSNPLGQVKIMYPNRYLIYLHDTPAQNLFSQNERAESSGCVRVENAVDLSAYVLESSDDWNEEKIRETIASGKTLQANINRPIQVHHFYWTAWRAGGKTVFTGDVYRLDKGIYDRLLGSD